MALARSAALSIAETETTRRPRRRPARHRMTAAPISTVVRELNSILGSQLVAYIGSVTDARQARLWASAALKPTEDAEQRLRFAHKLAKCLAASDGPRTTQAWFLGTNPMLGNDSPAGLIRTGDLKIDGPRIVAAERYFLAN